MKKLFLAAFVVATFIIYSVHQRRESADTVVKAPVVATAASPSPTATPIPTASGSAATPTPTPTASSGYKDGHYTGKVADAYYGNIQVAATIKNGKLTDVEFLQYPNDRDTSVDINTQAMPYLKQEAIQAQSANVNIVSGATDSSQAFIESLGSALSSAKS